MPGLLKGYPKSVPKRKKSLKTSPPPPESPETTKPKWTPLGFGKYVGKTLPQVLFTLEHLLNSLTTATVSNSRMILTNNRPFLIFLGPETEV